MPQHNLEHHWKNWLVEEKLKAVISVVRIMYSICKFEFESDFAVQKKDWHFAVPLTKSCGHR